VVVLAGPGARRLGNVGRGQKTASGRVMWIIWPKDIL
jgi:hypothetical protein